jgi:hypothetical protein
MADVPVGPAVARSRSIGGRLNSAPGQLRWRQTDESMIEVALVIVQCCRHRSPGTGRIIVGMFLGLGFEGPNCNGGTKAQRDTPVIQESRRCDSGSVRERGI